MLVDGENLKTRQRRRGAARRGMARPGETEMARLGMARRDPVRLGEARQDRGGLAALGETWPGLVWHGTAGPGKARQS